MEEIKEVLLIDISFSHSMEMMTMTTWGTMTMMTSQKNSISTKSLRTEVEVSLDSCPEWCPVK